MELIAVTLPFIALAVAVGLPAYKLYIAPKRAYKAALSQTSAGRALATAAERAAKAKEEADRRQKVLVSVARREKEKFIREFTELGFFYRYRSAESREKANAHIQRVTIDDAIICADLIVFPIKLPRGIKPLDIIRDDTQENLRIQCRRPDMQVIRTDYDGLFVHIPLRGATAGVPDTFWWEFPDGDKHAIGLLPEGRPLAIPVGLAPNRMFIYVDLGGDNESPHLLVAGTTGGGKSNFLNSLICTLLRRATPAEVQFVFIDLKTVELSGYGHIPHMWPGLPGVVTRPDGVSLALEAIFDEMNHRLVRLGKGGCRKISEWNKKYPDRPLPHLLLVFDEIAMVMLDRSLKKDAESMLARIAAQGRAVGIHIIACTQRPSADVVTGLIKTNITTRVAFNTDEWGSRTILENGMANGLHPVGRAIFLHRGQYTSLQTPLIHSEQIDATIATVNSKSDVLKPLITPHEMLHKGLEGRPSRLVDWYLLIRAEDDRITYQQFLQRYWLWHYNLETQKPIHTHKGGKFILWRGQFLQIDEDGGLPQTLEQMEKIEVLDGIFSE